MSHRKLKSKQGVSCYTPSQQKALELELDQQKDIIRGLEHDIEELRGALAVQINQHEQGVKNAEMMLLESHEIEMEELRTSHNENLQTIRNAQIQYDESLTTLTKTCEGFEHDNEVLSRMIKKQKSKIKELNKIRMDDEHKIKKLVESITAIQEGESNILEGIQSVCEGQEKEITSLAERLRGMKSEKTEIDAILDNLFSILGQHELFNFKPELNQTINDGISVKEKLSNLKILFQQYVRKVEPKSKFHKTTSSKESSSYLSTPPKTISTSKNSGHTGNNNGSKQAADVLSLQSLTTNGSFESGVSTPRSKTSFYAPKTKAILKKMEESKRKEDTIASLNLMPNYSFESDTVSSGSVRKHDDDFFPTKSEIKSVLQSNTISREFKLVQVVNKALRVYFNVDQNVDENETDIEPYQFITIDTLTMHHVQEFGAQTKFWYCTLTIRGKTWDPSAPSTNFLFPGGLVGSRMGKIVYSSKDHAIDATLIYVLKYVDSSGVWMDDFFGEDEFSCILRKEGTLRNNPWLVLMRKRGQIFLSYVKDITTLRTPIIMV